MSAKNLLKRIVLRLKAHWMALASKEKFDADWYCSVYPDVARAGMNPSVHYWAYGRAEGRLPSLGAKPPLMHSYPPEIDKVDKLNQILWSGFEHWAHPKLVEQARAGSEKAAWHLAGWHFAQGQWEEASRWLSLLDNQPHSSRHWLAWAKVCGITGDKGHLRALLAKRGAAEEFGSALPFAKANLAATSDERLSALNGLYAEHGLLALVRADSGRELALDNIKALDAGRVTYDKDRQPMISVVMAAYNASDTIETALRCILEQTWQCLEVIVVDDASDDDTLDKVKAVAENDARVRWVSSARNGGAYTARNHGITLARGEFVTVHDSDDWSHPQKLERQIEPLLNSPATVASYSWWVRVTEDMRCLGSWMLGEPFLELNQSSWLIRREVLSNVGLWDEVKVGGDMEFATRLQHHYGHKALISVLPQVPLAFSLTEAGSLTRAKATHISTLFYGLRRQYREGYAWWHRHCNGKPVLDNDSADAGRHPFPLPVGNWRSAEHTYDALLVANFAVEGAALRQVLTFLEAQWNVGCRVCLLHWPDRNAWHGNAVADEVFAWCSARNIHFAHFGIRLQVREVVFSDAALWLNPPSKTVQLDGETLKVSSFSGSLDKAFDDIEAYFRRGGVEWEPDCGNGSVKR